MTLDELDTPVAIVDLDKMEANIAKLQRHLDAHGIANRPHIKTHKIPEIARMQIEAGAIGITCQKIGEAEVMADGGIEDILISYNIMGAPKLKRLTELAGRTRLSVTADSAYTINGLSKAAEEAGLTITVLIEFESGKNRTGVQTPAEATELAKLVDVSPGLRFGGLMTYPSTEMTNAFVRQTKALLEAQGIEVETVSGGGTPLMWEAQQFTEVTEHRAGTYIYGDRKTIESGAMTLDDIALRVITTVVSRPTADRGILDGGSKTFTSDLLGLEGHGYIIEYPEADFYGQSEEHGHVDFSKCGARPQIGERVTVIPNHCCVVTNLFDEIAGVRGNQVEVVWPVAARGALK